MGVLDDFGPETGAGSEQRPAAAAARTRGISGSGWLRHMPPLLVGVACLSLLVPLAGPGLWDPPELEVAEYARRIAVNLLGGDDLRLEGTVNAVPTRRELGRGELPFTSVALGFRCFGLSEWAGRLPLALWAVAGVWATYALVARLADRKTACLSALVLCFTPLYFVHARSLLGDVVTMASFAIASAGLGLAGLDPTLSAARRALWWAVAALGLYAGFWCRGLMIGVAVPLAALGLTRLFTSRGSLRSRPSASFWDALCLALALGSALIGGIYLKRALEGADYSVFVGASSSHAERPPTHDALLHQLGHALFPMSAWLPFAFAMLFARPGLDDPSARLRVFTLTLLMSAALGYLLLAPYAGVLPFGGVAACAVAVAVMLRDLSRPSAGSCAIAMGVVALGVLLLNDLVSEPKTAFAAYAVYDTEFPAALLTWHRWLWVLGSLLCFGVFFGCCFETSPRVWSGAMWRRDYREYLARLRSIFEGKLWFVLVAAFVGLSLWALLVFLGALLEPLFAFADVWSLTRRLALNAWWLLGFGIVGAPLILLWLRDAFRWLTRRRAPSTGWAHLSRLATSATGLSASALGVFAAALSLGYYPALAATVSSKRVFSAYLELAKPNEALGSLGHAGAAARYYTRGSARSLENSEAALEWLTTAHGRRFLVLRADDLPELNSGYRQRTTPSQNLPVIETGSSDVLLASNQLLGAPRGNPFDAMISSSPPRVGTRVDANIGDRLEVLGWEMRDPALGVVNSMVPGKTYELCLFYQVVGRFDADWETFVHIDGGGRRFNADHTTLGGRYPLSYLLPGDYLIDRRELVLDPNFLPGDYQLYFGLFRGDLRMPVKRGHHDANRVAAGPVKVR